MNSWVKKSVISELFSTYYINGWMDLMVRVLRHFKHANRQYHA